MYKFPIFMYIKCCLRWSNNVAKAFAALLNVVIKCTKSFT